MGFEGRNSNLDRAVLRAHAVKRSNVCVRMFQLRSHKLADANYTKSQPRTIRFPHGNKEQLFQNSTLSC